MKEKNDNGISIFASFHENHQLSAKMLLSVNLWGFSPRFFENPLIKSAFYYF
jgi:hypothetical protein